MTRFFRHIRKTLIEHKNKRSYLLYGLGEVLLVVIGILIALQVNNWNEQQKLKSQEAQILASLHEETTLNLELIRRCKKQVDEQISVTDTLQAYLGPEYQGLSREKVNRWVGSTGTVHRCIIITDLLDELRSSGNLNLIRNRELRSTISSWTTSYDNMRTEEVEWFRNFSFQYLPYTNKWISWDDIDHLLNPADSTYLASKFDYDPNVLLQQFEYANILNVHKWRMNRVKTAIQYVNRYTMELDSLITMEMQ